MHPAFSVIVFSVTAGAGYGALVLLALARYFGVVPDLAPDQMVLAGLAGLVLVTLGLLSSTLHLANPKNAWRSFTRFKTSWLSREAVFAVLFYPVCLLWLYSEWVSGWTTLTLILGVVTVVIAMLVMLCTPMIYAQLKTIRQWHTFWVPINFMLLGFILGALVLLVLFAWQSLVYNSFLRWVQILLLAGVVAKVAYYLYIGRPAGPTINSALGFTQATVRLLDVGHSSGTFLTDEFGYQVARAKLLWLRVITLICGFVLPLLLISGLVGTLGSGLALLALVVALVGVLAERWLFFAEARHVVTLYHGAQTT